MDRLVLSKLFDTREWREKEREGEAMVKGEKENENGE